uniref:amino acid adenylation domain-containing protein n=1 Tax=Acetatifactor sp. TaxID=1872090 RepID=UPI00405610EE
MEYYNLTIAQQNIWNMQSYYEDSAISNICGAVFFRKNVKIESLKEALNLIIKQQTGLRMRFVNKDGMIKQYVKDYTPIDIVVKGFGSETDFDKYAHSCATTPLGLLECDMYQLEIVQVENKVGVLAVLSHLVSDAWTFSILAKEMDRLLRSLEMQEQIVEETHDYIQYMKREEAYLASDKYQSDDAFWREKYREKPSEASIKANMPHVRTISSDRVSIKVSKKIMAGLKEFCCRSNITPAVCFETAWNIYLSKTNPQNDTITLGVPVLNRAKVNEKKTAGMFISTMPLTLEVSKQDSVELVAKKITKAHTEIFRHKQYPYSNILQNLRETHGLEKNPYDVMFSFQNAQADIDAELRWYSNGYSEVPLTMHVDNRENSDAYTLTVDYQTEVFREQKEVYRIVERLEYVLEQMFVNPHAKLGDISIVPPKEMQRILYEFNDTAADYPRDRCVHELFMEQAAKTPDTVAVVFEDKELTYRELDEMSNVLARILQEKDVKRGDIVPMIAKRSYYIVVAMLGILKAGAAYMPIAPDYPKDRVQFIVEEAKSKVACVLGYEEQLENIAIIRLDELALEDAEDSKRLPVACINSSDDLCYVIFTSGSTGVPKGVMIKHRSVLNYGRNNGNNKACHAIIQAGYKKIISVTNIVFDIFVTESILPLLNGMTIYFTSDEEVFSQSAINRIVVENKVEILQTTPTKMKGYLFDKKQKDYLSTLKVIILGGEALTTGLYEELRMQSGAEIINIYGPAETTVWSSNAKVESNDITIGKPIANTQIYILDSNNSPVPIGVPGELCIAGDGVGKGYLNRPELTAERFVPNPFATERNGHGKVMYHTGDLAAWRENGEIEYWGRIDTQVKIRGLRIELGEIESVMSEFSGIGMCAVTDKKDEEGRQYLVGYYTTVSDEKKKHNILTAVHIDEKELRKHLSAKLPKYMVPNYFMHLEKLPMTPSGKIDRKNLPCPNLSIRSEEELVLPQNELEERVLKLWKEELHIERLGCNQDFFEVGGDSLLAIALLTRLEQEFGVRLQMKDIFECRTVTAQADRLENCVGESRDIIVAMDTERFPLTPQQRAVYLASIKEPESLLYNMPAQILLPDNVDKSKLVEALKKVFCSFAALRMRVSAEANGLYGVVDSESELCIENYGEEEKDKFVRPFDLDTAPLWRVGLSEKYLLIDMHHLIADGSSLQILIQAVRDLYEGKEIVQEAVGYGDYAVYLQEKLKEESIEEGLNWYRETLPATLEKISFPKVGKKSYWTGESYQYQLATETKDAIKKTCERYQITETMLHMTTYGLLLKSYSDMETVAGSVIIANRQHPEANHTIGMFVNTLPVAFEFTKGLSVAGLLHECKEKVLKLYEYAEIPFETIMQKQERCTKDAFNTSFVYQANSVFELSLEGQKIVPEFIDTHTAKFDLSVEVTPNEKGDFLRLEYRTEKVDRELAERMARIYEGILVQLGEIKYVDHISVLTQEEERKILFEFNDTVVDYPRDKCIHELFMEQAARTPEAVAVVFEDKRITYRELDEMSNVLAHILQEKGVKLGDIVPLISKSSYYIPIAMLGILKAGGAYMPITPDYPKNRVQFIINEAKSKIACVFGYEEQLENIELLRLDELALEDAEDIMSLPIECNNSSEDLCYVIFTSGSTGVPKGVMITHKNLHNFVAMNQKNCYQSSVYDMAKNVLATTAITFDISIFEIMISILGGLQIVIPNEEEILSGEEISKLIVNNKIQALHITPTKIRQYMLNSQFRKVLEKVKIIMVGGERFPSELFELLHTCTQATIYNGYGPTETTIGNAFKKVESTDITIGKPIANTQIYILDSNSNPVPIGVPGELCIAGDGVGKGYLNRPELTAERFVSNPFATESNGHGKVMYHTGDLAAWRENGEIDYLGRIDTQVKIRGLRIELGEIESVMSQFPGIRMCAVTDKKDEEERQYLVGYYTTASDEKENQNIMTVVHIDEKELRKYLSAKLPKYMVPNFFVHLEEIPMTPSGKTDRKNLPMPRGIKNDSTEYVAPVTEIEKKLCLAMEAVLNYSPIGMKHDFFEYGGDSLKAMELIIRLEESGYRVNLQDIFEYPSALELVQTLRNEKSEEIQIEHLSERFEKYAPLLERNRIRDKYPAEAVSIKTVLISGITGFLGAHIADALLQDEKCVIYCLVRSKSTEDRRGRFPEMLEYYFGEKYKACIGTRIIPVVGDITNEILSEELPEKVDMVIHAAATVKHYGAYEYFYKVNTLGTKHMADYAQRVDAKFIHISTISVSGNSLADGFDTEVALEEREFGEDCLYQKQDLKNVYVRSKFEAECVVLDAMLQGLQANIIRVGNLTNRSKDYVFQPNYRENAFLSRIKAAMELGCLPEYLLPLYTEFSPVDDTAEAIVRIARHFHMEHTIYHVYSNQNLYFDRLLKILRKLEIPMSVVAGEEFTERLKATVDEEGAHIYEAFINDMSRDGRLQYETNIHILNDFTIDYLKRLGFEWTKIDYEYVRGYIEYFKKVGYLEV